MLRGEMAQERQGAQANHLNSLTHSPRLFSWMGRGMAFALIQSAYVAPTLLLYRHRALTLALVRREILDRYVGQMLGALWVFGHPLILVSV